MTEDQARYEGWAILEIFGHQRFAGFVKTEYYGTACMFRLDVPPLEERTRVTKRAGTVGGQWVQAGATVQEGAVQGYSKLFGVGAIYAMTPCTQEAALAAVEEIQPRPLMLVSLPPEKALESAALPVSMCPACGAPQNDCNCLLGDEDEDPYEDGPV